MKNHSKLERMCDETQLYIRHCLPGQVWEEGQPVTLAEFDEACDARAVGPERGQTR